MYQQPSRNYTLYGADPPFVYKSRDLLRLKTNGASVPALKPRNGDWVMEPQRNADLFAETFAKQYFLTNGHVNCFKPLEWCSIRQPSVLAHLPSEDAPRAVLVSLRTDNATGPDHTAAQLLRRCAFVLAAPVATLAANIISNERWPDI